MALFSIILVTRDFVEILVKILESIYETSYLFRSMLYVGNRNDFGFELMAELRKIIKSARFHDSILKIWNIIVILVHF